VNIAALPVLPVLPARPDLPTLAPADNTAIGRRR
jgi:hypothetical protein